MPNTRNQSPNLVAGGNVLPYSFVKVSAAAPNTALQAGANDPIIGISQPALDYPPGVFPPGGSSPTYAAVAGETLELFGLGDICKIQAGVGGFTAGDYLESDGSGNAITSGAGSVRNIGAIALQTTAQGYLGEVQILIFQKDANAAAASNISLTGATLSFQAATGLNQIALVDNLADALSVSDGAVEYMTFVTTTNAAAVNIKVTTTMTGTAGTGAGAGGAITSTGGTPGVTGIGGAVVSAGGIGGATSGAGGAVTNTGGAGTNGNAAGGAVSNTGGAGQGSAAGGASSVVGGVGGATGAGGAALVTGGAGGATSGTGGAATVTAGAGANGNAAGGVASLIGGAGQGTGAGGAIAVTGGASGAGATGNGGAVAITGGAALSTNGAGGQTSVVGGLGKGTGAGGAVLITGGASQAGGATGAGGAVTITGGASATTNDAGGAAALIGGLGTGTGAGGAITITSGAAGATGVAGAVNISVGAATAGNGSAVTITGGNGAGGTNSGGNINLIPGTAVSTGTPGEVQVNSVSGLFDLQYNSPLMTTAVPATGTAQPIFMADRAYRVKGARFCVVTHGTSEAFTITKDTSGTAPGAGTALLAAPIATTVANTPVVGSLAGISVANLTMAAGDRLSFLTSGTIGAAAGLSIGVLLEPC